MDFNNISNITFIGSDIDYTHFFGKSDDLVFNAGLSDIIRKTAINKKPVQLKLYVARECPHCPTVIKTIIPIARACQYINLEIIDGTFATKEAEADKIMSVPTLILNNGFRLTGAVNEDELIDIIINVALKNDPLNLTAPSLKFILEQGRADWIAEQMVKHNAVFDSFIELIIHKTWSVRLGSMVILEELSEKAPKPALTIAPKLISYFKELNISNQQENIPIMGDILYALGEIGDNAVKDEIIRLVSGKIIHQDILEASKEAVESITQKNLS